MTTSAHTLNIVQASRNSSRCPKVHSHVFHQDARQQVEWRWHFIWRRIGLLWFFPGSLAICFCILMPPPPVRSTKLPISFLYLCIRICIWHWLAPWPLHLRSAKLPISSLANTSPANWRNQQISCLTLRDRRCADLMLIQEWLNTRLIHVTLGWANWVQRWVKEIFSGRIRVNFQCEGGAAPRSNQFTFGQISNCWLRPNQQLPICGIFCS